MSSTPKRSKSTEKRNNILSAASKLFLQNGFEGVSMDKVAVAAKVSKQTVYSHFGNKEDLFSAIIVYKASIHDLTASLFDVERPVNDVLMDLAQHLSELLMSEEAICMLRVCIADATQRAHIAKLFWEAGPQRLSNRFGDYLIEQNTSGKMSIDNPHFASQQFLSMIKANAYFKRALGQPNQTDINELPAYLESCVHMFTKAYID